MPRTPLTKLAWRTASILAVAIVIAVVVSRPKPGRRRPVNGPAPRIYTQIYTPPTAPEKAAPPNVAETVSVPVPRGALPPLGKKAAAAAAAQERIFGLAKVHRFEVSLARAEWDAMQLSTVRGGGGVPGTDYTQADGRIVHIGGGFGGYFPWAHADLKIDGLAFDNVGLRYRGNGSFRVRPMDSPLRASMKLKLDFFKPSVEWLSERTLNLQGGTVDLSLTRETIAFAIFRRAGVIAPRTAYVDAVFTVPGIFDRTSAGFYTLVEGVNNTFLKTALPPGTGLLLKPEVRGGLRNFGSSWSAYEPVLRPDREATPEEQQRVMEFCQLLSQPDTALFRQKIGTYLDVDEFLRYIAVNAFLENWDSFLNGQHNYYLYLDPNDNRFRLIAWDEDLTMGLRSEQVGNISLTTPYKEGQPMIRRLLDDPAVFAHYRAIVRELAGTAFSQTELEKLCDLAESVVGRRGLSPRNYLKTRAAAVQQLVASWGVPSDNQGPPRSPEAAPKATPK